MTEITIQELQQENAQLKNQVRNTEAERDAAKHMFNESSTAHLQIRTNLIVAQRNYYDLLQTNSTLSQEIEQQKGQLKVLADKLLEVCPPKINEVLSAPNNENHVLDSSHYLDKKYTPSKDIR